MLFPDDTNVIVTDKDHDSFNQKTNITSLSQWFYINNQVLNIAKTNILEFKPKTAAHVPLIIYYKDNIRVELKSTKFLGMPTENHMNWKNHAERILSKLMLHAPL